jgi:hypothetical protein
MSSMAKVSEDVHSELYTFMSGLDSLFVSAGPYFSCTHSLVLKLYGMLATYIVVLIQSV